MSYHKMSIPEVLKWWHDGILSRGETVSRLIEAGCRDAEVVPENLREDFAEWLAEYLAHPNDRIHIFGGVTSTDMLRHFCEAYRTPFLAGRLATSTGSRCVSESQCCRVLHTGEDCTTQKSEQSVGSDT